MKILVVQPTSDKQGHYGIWTTKICQAMAGLGHEVTLCTNRLEPERYIKEKPLFKVHAVGNGKYDFGRFDQARVSRPLYYFYGYFRVSYAVVAAALRLAASTSKEDSYDVIFITDSEFLMASLLLKRYARGIAPVVMQVNAANFTFDSYCGSVLKKLYKVFQRGIFKSTLGKEIKGFAVLGQWHKDNLREQLSLPESFHIDVVPDAGEVTDETIASADPRARLGIEYKGDIILFFGMLRKDKGIAGLLEAIGQLRDKEFRLLIVGAPTEYTEQEILDIIKKNCLEGKVIFRPGYAADTDVPLYFYAADALILPYSSIYTGGSGPLLKGACTFKRPVIVTDVSEMGRLTREHSMGLLARPDDPDSLASKVEEFLSMDEAARQRLSDNASKLGKTNSWEAVAEKFVELFAKVSA